MSPCRTAADETMAHKAFDVHIQATKILKAVVEELGGSEPTYENVSWYISPVEYQVGFNIPSNGGVDGTVRVALCGLMPEGTSKEDACEEVARDALELLQHEHGINVLDYNWIVAAELRGRCAALVEKFKENKYIYDFVRSKSIMVADGIEFASDVFVNKAYEVDNALEKKTGQVDMAVVFRDCARELRAIRQKLIGWLDNLDGLTKMLQEMARYQLPRPYVDYTALFLKVGAFKVINGLTIVLEETASKAGFQMPVITTEECIGGFCIGKVQLHHLVSGSKMNFESSIVSDKREAICMAIQRCIVFLTDTYGFNAVDPNSYACRDLKKIEKAIRAELVHLANGVGAVEDWACETINDIHHLADKYDGSVSDKDSHIRGLLVAICVDLSRHLDAVPELRKDAIENSKF